MFDLSVSAALQQENLAVCEWLLMVLVLALVLLLLPLSIWFCVKVREHHTCHNNNNPKVLCLYKPQSHGGLWR